MSPATPRAMKNLHVPLPGPVHAELRVAAERSGRPATELAREAIVRWLTEERRAARRAVVAEYAAAEAGTPADLDPLLERAAVQHLRSASRTPSGKRKRA